MLRKSRLVALSAAMLVAANLSACSTSEFDAAPSSGASLKGEADANDGDAGDSEADAKNKNSDGNGDGDSDQSRADGAAGDDESTKDGDDSDGDGPEGGNEPDDGDGEPCRFLEDDTLAEEIPDGPGLAINPNDHKASWSREGKDIHFPLVAYKVPGEQEVQIVENVDSNVPLPDMHFDLPSNHWQLKPITQFDLHGPGHSKKFIYHVKYSYSVMLTNSKSKNCKMSASLTDTPFLDRTGGGCFALSTPVRMADGSDRKVAMLNVGDQVFNPSTGKAAVITQITSGPEADKGMIEVGFGSSRVRVTEGHPIPTRTGLKQAKALTKADRVLAADGSYHLITTLRRLPVDKTQQVRNLVINPTSSDPRDHMVLADGLVTGDLYLQQRLAADGEPPTPGILSRIAGVLAKLLSF